MNALHCARNVVIKWHCKRNSMAECKKNNRKRRNRSKKKLCTAVRSLHYSWSGSSSTSVRVWVCVIHMCIQNGHVARNFAFRTRKHVKIIQALCCIRTLSHTHKVHMRRVEHVSELKLLQRAQRSGAMQCTKLVCVTTTVAVALQICGIIDAMHCSNLRWCMEPNGTV